MKTQLLLSLALCFCMIFSPNQILAQIPQNDPECSTDDLDSANAVALPYYGNNQMLDDYLQQNGYNDLKYISFPSTPLRTSSAATFLEPRF